MMTTFDEFVNKVLSVIPTAQVEEDNYGQLIIYTGLSRSNDGNIIHFEPDPTDPTQWDWNSEEKDD